MEDVAALGSFVAPLLAMTMGNLKGNYNWEENLSKWKITQITGSLYEKSRKGRCRRTPPGSRNQLLPDEQSGQSSPG